MNNLVIGIVAHVDAGKTTLSENILYRAGATDRIGRVDRGDAHLDSHSLERERGITIFSKQAVFDLGDTHVTLIDTPGHIDFSCETERSLSVQDYAILVISATDGVTAHTRTLWQLLAARHIPTFIFVNKTDLSTRIQRELADELRVTLSSQCVDFTYLDRGDFYEDAAGADESLMAEYFDTDALSQESLREAIRLRKIFPCYFGSALRDKGVGELMSGIQRFTEAPSYSETIFGARIYKIMRDRTGRRMAFAKITGGQLRPKDTLTIKTPDGTVTEKVEELRVWSLDKSRPLTVAMPGTVCAILGPVSTKAGMGLGVESDDSSALTPALSYRMRLPEGVSPYEVYLKLSELSEEDPTLGIAWDGEHSEIRVNLMGEIQLEVLTRLIKDRLSIEVGFDEGSILYRETVKDTVRGAGHFEPLRHYAEVHVELSPLPEGSGVIADTECDSDVLSTNWQRLVLTHIEERVHRGRLVGAPLSDVRITLIAGRAHLKHTEGGDFRQATYRAIRQAVMKSEAVLLEPIFNFRCELPSSALGRFLTDLTNMHGEVKNTENDGESAAVEGVCPVSTMRSYANTLRAYTHGYGRLNLTVGAYAPCHNTEEVVAASGYDPEFDRRNLSGSVFCKGGAGYFVPWQEADALMHIRPEGEAVADADEPQIPERARAVTYSGTAKEDKELMRIFEATYGKIKTRHAPEKRVNEAKPKDNPKPPKPKKRGEEFLLLDGYNVIYSWEHLSRIAERDFAMARDMLIRDLCNYTAFRKCKTILVFDAYRVKDGKGSVERCGNTTVVYTKEKQTADAYIEKATYEIAKDNYVRVVTSDLDEQYIILGNGALRVSPREFLTELADTDEEIKKYM